MSEAVPDLKLSRRERQVMDVVWRVGEASAVDIQAAIPDPPSYSAVRALLAVLVDKGHLTQDAEGRRHVYRPTVRREDVRGHALRRVLATFFDDSPESLLSTLLSRRERRLKPDEITRLRRLLDAHVKQR